MDHSINFSRAIVRTPGDNFDQGLTTQDLGMPDYATTVRQHTAYCQALRQCGLEVIPLEADLAHPDATFVEDAAILTPGCAILTHPGAPSREGEVRGIRPVLERFYDKFYAITAPGTLDGGDICEAGTHFFIGISLRTNPEGARQLAGFLVQEGYTFDFIDVRAVPGILHLKSGLAYLGENTLVVINALAAHPAFQGYRLLCTPPQEDYAANCVRVNAAVLLAQGFPRTQALLEQAGYHPLPVDMSEYQKMDGGLSCLSLRF
jgi:dimethylargininase